VIGSFPYGILVTLTGLIALIMPVIVTTIDFDDHLREHRGLLEHKSHCWMESESAKNRHDNFRLEEKAPVASES
jgi:hypothetical protein